MRSNISQDRIFHELKDLRRFYENSLRIAKESENLGDPMVTHLSTSLRRLAKSVKGFHSSASSIASSNMSSTASRAEPVRPPQVTATESSTWSGSEIGGLAASKRWWINEWQYAQNDLSVPKPIGTREFHPVWPTGGMQPC